MLPPSGPYILDWGDTGVGQPLLDQPAFLAVTPDAELAETRERWSTAWRRILPNPLGSSAVIRSRSLEGSGSFMSIEAFGSVLSGAQAGAEWALTIRYRICILVFRYLPAREPIEAEDLASEVWLDVAAGIGRFRGDEDGFRAWIFTIARRRLLDHRRRASVRRNKPVPQELLGGDRPTGDVEGEAMASLREDAAVALIASLPSDQCDVVLLRVIGDLSVADVAKILDKRPERFGRSSTGR